MKDRTYLRDLLVQQGFARTPDEAARLILAAEVLVDGSVVAQAGALVTEDAVVTLRSTKRFVSRGGLKLEGALDDFGFSPAGLRCIDAGASTGGFTDCLLKRGAVQVVAVDVGYGQFDWGLRNDARVVLFERTNIAKVDPKSLGAPFAVLVADLSFTSLARMAAQLAGLLDEGGSAFTLVKPQFELPKEAVKGGVVRSLELHAEALDRVTDAFENHDLGVRKLGYSHLLGPKGNREFWIWALKGGATATIDTIQIVRQAHAALPDTGN